jgi:phytoene desaturase
MTSVLVVGAGVGGIAAAGRLARSGYDVTVVEKRAAAGGRCNKIVRDGHRFDVGPSLFLMPEVFAETYAALGERMEDHLDLRRVDPTYRVRFDDGLELALTADINRMQAQLERIGPGAFTGYLENLTEGHKHYRSSLERFVGRNFYSIFQYFSPRNLPLLFQLHALETHYHRIGRYFDDPRLKAAFTFQNMYLGLSPYEAPATYSLLQYTELADGVWFPMGGMYRIVESLVAIAESLGVRFVYEAPVKRIDVDGGVASGLLLEDGSKMSADVLVANADLPYVYDSLLPDRAAAERLARKQYTCSALMFYWATDVSYPALEHHNVFLRGDYRASFDRIFKDHSLPNEPSFYVHVPNRTDPAAAPPGCDDVMVLVPAGHLDERTRQDWEALQSRARASVLSRLAKIGITDLEQHIKFEVAYTPQDWQSMFNLAKGAAFGLGHSFTQVGYLRPQNRHARYRNLYFTGASTHPGTGVPIVLLSARLVSERIQKEQGLD